MRELKFRAWLEEYRIMKDVASIDFLSKTVGVTIELDSEKFCEKFGLDKDIIPQEKGQL